MVCPLRQGRRVEQVRIFSGQGEGSIFPRFCAASFMDGLKGIH